MNGNKAPHNSRHRLVECSAVVVSRRGQPLATHPHFTGSRNRISGLKLRPLLATHEPLITEY